MRKILFFTILIFFISTTIRAQDTMRINKKLYEFINAKSDTVVNNGNSYIIKYVVQPEEAEGMRSNGKIYVVVTVLATIFAGIFAYLIYMNRKISKLEKEK